jgi:hypothetical protein
MKTRTNSPDVTFFNIEQWRAEFFPKLQRTIGQQDIVLSLMDDLKQAVVKVKASPSASNRHRETNLPLAVA